MEYAESSGGEGADAGLAWVEKHESVASLRLSRRLFEAFKVGRHKEQEVSPAKKSKKHL